MAYTPTSYARFIIGALATICTVATAAPTHSIVGARHIANAGGGASNVYAAKLTTNGVVVRDLIPVRFTNESNQREGALYDQVSGALFRGSFIIGPDK